MELNLNIVEHRNNLAKYVAGEMTEPEIEKFEAIVNSDPSNKKLVNSTISDWEIIGTNKTELPNTDNAWNRLKTRIEQEASSAQNRSRKPAITRWAVAAMAIIIVASTYFALNIKQQNIIIKGASGLTTLVHTLPDGSRVFLEGNSQISYTKRFAKNNRNVTLNGEAFFDITKNPKIPFVIETQNTSIKVLGTSFSVKSGSKTDFELVVQTGSVSIKQKNSNTKSIIAAPGDRVTLIDNHLAISKENIAPLQNLKNKRLQFKDEPLANIIQTINKAHQTNIALGSTALGNRKLTVTFMNNSVQSMVEIISNALELEVLYDENTITLWQP